VRKLWEIAPLEDERLSLLMTRLVTASASEAVSSAIVGDCFLAALVAMTGSVIAC